MRQRATYLGPTTGGEFDAARREDHGVEYVVAL